MLPDVEREIRRLDASAVPVGAVLGEKASELFNQLLWCQAYRTGVVTHVRPPK